MLLLKKFLITVCVINNLDHKIKYHILRSCLSMYVCVCACMYVRVRVYIEKNKDLYRKFIKICK